MPLPSDHPFAEFNEYFYMESGSPKMRMPIYIWKKGNKGLLVELYLNDRESGPRARIYTLIFDDDYLFNLDRNVRNINKRNEDELYLLTAKNIKEVLASL